VASDSRVKKRKCVLEEYDLDQLARESEGYVGAEIEQTVIDAMYLAFNQDMRKITTDDIVGCLKRQVPLSRSQREIVEALRRYLHEGRAASASAVSPQQHAAPAGIRLDPLPQGE
jgi:SpoVK/Ycf46/Vps4 family AAA+-type ATPase